MEKLTVVILTYNLEEYIEQAVESVLMQKVNFEYKIRISDDCSTDHTVNIIKKLQDKYSDKIELLLSSENGGSLKNSNRAFAGIKSEYIALLDGDDFWIGENQLQKKIDFLDSHPEYTLCGGDTVMLYGDYTKKQIISAASDFSYGFEDYLQGHVPFVHTSALVLRNCIYKDGIPQIYYTVEDTFENCAVRGEEFRFIIHLEKGKLMVFTDVVSCYRIHEMGMWQGASETKRMIETAISRNFYDKYYAHLSDNTFRKMCISSYRNLMRYLIEQQHIYNEFCLNEKETYLLAEYLKDISNRKIAWTDCPVCYLQQEPKVDIIRRIWRIIRKRFCRK